MDLHRVARQNRVIGWLILGWGMAAAGPLAAQGYDLQPRRITLIAPGTEIGSEAPQGWTHLILKSKPRCTHGDVSRVSRSNIEMAGLLANSLVARVERGQDGFRLVDVATGVSTSIGGRDVIITPETQKQLGANFGFIQRLLLNEFHDQQQTVTVICRGPRFALFDTPIVLRAGQKNHAMLLRYAVIVDGASGNMETLCWALTKNSQGQPDAIYGPMHWLAANTMVDCRLYVDAGEYTLGVPSKNAFGCLSIPPGQVQINVPPRVGQILAAPRLSQTEAGQVEQWLGDAVRQAQAALPRQSR